MNRVHIEWGNLDRSESVEQDILTKAQKILTFAPNATKLVVYLQVVNAHHSSGIPSQKVSLELRLPQNQDVRAEQEGSDFHKCLRDAQKAILVQVEAKKKSHFGKALPMHEVSSQMVADEGNAETGEINP